VTETDASEPIDGTKRLLKLPAIRVERVIETLNWNNVVARGLLTAAGWNTNNKELSHDQSKQ